MNIKEIVEITYSRIMQLRFSYMYIQSILSNNNIALDYPNLCFALLSSFATDAYITIDGLLSTGNYSFGRLAQDDDELKSCVNDCKNEIEKEIPEFHEIRNKMFCHAVEKKTYDSISSISKNFMSIFYSLMSLHANCRNKYGISEDDFKHYSSEDFNKLQSELHNFCDLLLTGYLAKGARDFLDNRKDTE